MISRLVGAATLFTAGSLMAGAPPALGATPIQGAGSANAAWVMAGCGSDQQDAKGEAKPAKAKDSSCGKGSCGSKDAKAKKDGSCGKDKMHAKKDASCGKDKPAEAKKDAAPDAEKK